MKKAAIVTAIASALVSGSTFAATVYDQDGTTLSIGGRAEARFNISDNNETEENSTFKDKSRARINLKGKTQVANDLYGFGKYEAELDNAEDISNRYFYAGIGTDLGEFSYGKQDSAQVMLTDVTDSMATFGADAADIVSGNKDKRENNFLFSAKFDQVKIKANYIAANEKDSDSFGIAGMYSLDMGLTLGAGYVTQKNANLDDDQVNLAAQFKKDALKLGGLYTMATKADEEYTGYELSATFKASKQLSLVGVYNFQENDDTKTEEANNIAIEAVYKFNGHIRTYAGYKFEQLDNKDDQLQAGIRYDF